MGENVLVGTGGIRHASTGGGMGHVRVGGGMEHAGTGGGAGHAGAGRARDMQARRGRKACERRRGHGTCRRGRKGSGDANASPGRKGALPAKGSAIGGANVGGQGPVRESTTWSQLKLPFCLEVAGFSELPRVWDLGLSIATHNSHALRLGGIAQPGPCNTSERGTCRGPVTPLFQGTLCSMPKSRQSWKCGLLGLATIPCVVVESNGEGTFRDENSLEVAQNGEKIHIFSPLSKHQMGHRERKKIGQFLHACQH